jgi:hypothetical protein
MRTCQQPQRPARLRLNSRVKLRSNPPAAAAAAATGPGPLRLRRVPPRRPPTYRLRLRSPHSQSAPAGLQGAIPSDPGIRGPLHPRRLRCPPSPYRGGYGSVGRLAGRGASSLSMLGLFGNGPLEPGPRLRPASVPTGSFPVLSAAWVPSGPSSAHQAGPPPSSLRGAASALPPRPPAARNGDAGGLFLLFVGGGLGARTPRNVSSPVGFSLLLRPSPRVAPSGDAVTAANPGTRSEAGGSAQRPVERERNIPAGAGNVPASGTGSEGAKVPSVAEGNPPRARVPGSQGGGN